MTAPGNIETQAEALLSQAEALLPIIAPPQDTALAALIADVRATLTSAPSGFLWSCVDGPGTSVLSNWRFRTWCEEWSTALFAALVDVSDFLCVEGFDGQAEALFSLAERSETYAQTAQATLDPTIAGCPGPFSEKYSKAGSLCIPPALQWGALLVAALAVYKVVK